MSVGRKSERRHCYHDRCDTETLEQPEKENNAERGPNDDIEDESEDGRTCSAKPPHDRGMLEVVFRCDLTVISPSSHDILRSTRLNF
jgi:hypothetical protein